MCAVARCAVAPGSLAPLWETPQPPLTHARHHAVRWWYAALTRVHKEGAIFNWQSTFYTTLTKFREAVIRYAVQVRRHYIQRKHTNLTAIVPASQRARFNTLLTIQLDGTYTLTDALTQAIQDAKLAHETAVGVAAPPP